MTISTAKISMCLGPLLAGLSETGLAASTTVTGLALDSRKVKMGDLFIACRGHKTHGIEYIDSAIANGATTIVYDISRHNEQHQALVEHYSQHIQMFKIDNLQQLVGEIASRFYGRPSKYMHVVAVTGTDGKTSVSQFIAQILSTKYCCGVIGTLGAGIFGKLNDIDGRTTPDAVTLQQQLYYLKNNGVKAVVVEASSHGLDQYRLSGTFIDVAVFTNLSHEHLDYHGSIKRYAQSKHKLFQWTGLKTAVLNFDNEYGREWSSTLPDGCSLIGYSTTSDFHVHLAQVLRCDDLILGNNGIEFNVSSPLGSGRVNTPLLGRFNASNLLAALGAVLALDLKFDEAIAALSQVTTVSGRMEAIHADINKPLVVVDYAHTPDALSHVLHALREHCSGLLWVVFGCGGDRDKLKRPMMGKLAEALADVVVITNDNPRTEDPFSIIEQITSGMQAPDSAYVIPNRAQAISRAITVASRRDVVLIAGKGHESEQCIGNVCLPFNDVETARHYLGGVAVNG